MNENDKDYDKDTDEKHIHPVGLEHQQRRNKGEGRWYTDVKISHYIIKAHQEAFPELADKMRYNPDAPNVYAAFLAMLPLELKGKLTKEFRRKILKTYRLLK